MTYKAIIWLESNGTYSVMFPDFPNCFSMGDNLAEARHYAHEALDLHLEDNPVKGFARPSLTVNKDALGVASEYSEVCDIKVSKNKAFALKLRWLRQDLGLTQKTLAELLHIGLYAYQRLENPRLSNPTMKTIEQLEAVIHQELVTV